MHAHFVLKTMQQEGEIQTLCKKAFTKADRKICTCKMPIIFHIGCTKLIPTKLQQVKAESQPYLLSHCGVLKITFHRHHLHIHFVMFQRKETENPPKGGDVNYSLCPFLPLLLSFGHFIFSSKIIK